MRLNKFFLICAAIVVACVPAQAQRKPVLPQINLPHPYYYRELYLPQLTSGPSSVAWGPGSDELIYSMAGSLWRQKLNSKEAKQITDGAGYDYEPDWSPDGKSVVYVSYQKDAMELWLLDVASGNTTQLTRGGAVNLEPRWSPDGKQIVFVSTEFNGRFHIFRADVNATKLENVVRLTGETKSPLPRYYYSAYDTEISPVWTRDGKEIVFISNRGHIHGSGGFWKMKAEPGAEAKEIHYEETNWKARPDFSPDGSRMVYSSYLGGTWHNVWAMPANGGDAFPLTYNDFDATFIRWSPDGKRLAYISNKSGNTEISIQEYGIAEGSPLVATQLAWLRSRQTIKINVSSEKGKPEWARVSVTDTSGKFYAPRDAWIQADDGYDRSQLEQEAHYFYAKTAVIEVPSGPIHLAVSKGYEYEPFRRTFEVFGSVSQPISVVLKKLDWNKDSSTQWISADLHVHMNYGGTYKSRDTELLEKVEGEGLRIANNLIVNKEQRFPDIGAAKFDGKVKSSANAILVPGQEFHTSYWGHRGILRLKNSLLIPGYAGYPNTAAASLYPMNTDVFDMARQQDALVGAVHPFDEVPDPFANPPQRITDELPVDVALGKLDYMEIVGFSDHKSTAAVWYRLLNLGFRLPAGAGTDATTNYAAPIRGNVGFDRVYTTVPRGPVNLDVWMNSLKAGKTFVTNGPLIQFTLAGKTPGDELVLNASQKEVSFTAQLRSVVPVDHLEVVCNGKPVTNLKLTGTRKSADAKGAIALEQSGWCLLRTWSDKPEWPVLDAYAYATTSPVYVNIAGQKPKSAADAKYFVAWIERTISATGNYPDWNSADEKKLILDRLQKAKGIFEDLQ